MTGRIDFLTCLGPSCPICGRPGCLRPISPYWRYAIDLYPYKKERVPIARFLCRHQGRTISLLPHQLIPYVQYTADAVLRTLLNVLELQGTGRRGFHGACEQADPDSSVTPWLICCWLALFVKGLRRAHPTLCKGYDLTAVRSETGGERIRVELQGYLIEFGAWPPSGSVESLAAVAREYGRRSGRFLLGTPSQDRRSPCP